MPDGTGEELITRLRETDPALKVLILTGHGAMLGRRASTGGSSSDIWPNPAAWTIYAPL